MLVTCLGGRVQHATTSWCFSAFFRITDILASVLKYWNTVNSLTLQRFIEVLSVVQFSLKTRRGHSISCCSSEPDQVLEDRVLRGRIAGSFSAGVKQPVLQHVQLVLGLRPAVLLDTHTEVLLQGIELLQPTLLDFSAVEGRLKKTNMILQGWDLILLYSHTWIQKNVSTTRDEIMVSLGSLSSWEEPWASSRQCEEDGLPPLQCAEPTTVPKSTPGHWCGCEMAPGPSTTGTGCKQGLLKIRRRKIPWRHRQQNKPWSQGQTCFIPMVLPLTSLRAACLWRLGHLWKAPVAWPSCPRCSPKGWGCLWPLLCTSQPSKSCLEEKNFSLNNTTNNEVVIAFYNAWTVGWRHISPPQIRWNPAF